MPSQNSNGDVVCSKCGWTEFTGVKHYPATSEKKFLWWVIEKPTKERIVGRCHGCGYTNVWAPGEIVVKGSRYFWQK